MPPVPDPSSTPSSPANLNAGLAALKNGDYPTAIAQLTAVALPHDHPLYAKAQMGLVMAYTRTGELQQAINGCQLLQRSRNPQVSEWAERTLIRLRERQPDAAAQPDAETGDSPLPGSDRRSPDNTQAGPALESTSPDLTGFTPFPSGLPTTSSDSRDRSGFVAFDESSQSDQLTVADSGPPTLIQAESPSDPPLIDNLLTPTTATSANNTNTIGNGSPLNRTPIRDRPVNAPPSPPATSPGEPAVPSAEGVPLYQPVWRQAGRLRQGKSLGKVKRLRLVALQAVTAIAAFWLVQRLIYSVMVSYGVVLTKIPFLGLRRDLFDAPVWPIVILLGALLLGSRWILDGLLTVLYGLQPLSLNQLGTNSPETVQSLNRYCRQYRLPMPTLGVLPVAAPLAFSYGGWPQVARIVVSQGLLDQLADDEIATIYASEIGHIACWDMPLMSLLTVLVQLPYTLYWQISEWGTREETKLVQTAAAVVASLSYGLYRLLRWVGLWLARQRVYYSDRVAVELTGNPNGFARALVKLAVGTAGMATAQAQTSYLLEGFDLITPIGQRMALTLGSLYPHMPLESALVWEWINPYRSWLVINHAHPLVGERLHLLMLYARHWKLETELDWEQVQRVAGSRPAKTAFSGRQWRVLLLQGAPYFGFVIGLTLAFAFAAIGWIAWRTGIPLLAWMYGDHSLVWGLPLVGFSLGTFIRINPFFPDIAVDKRSGKSADPLRLLEDTAAIPVDSPPIRLEGVLVGRPGIGNALNQDLWLKTETDFIRLHCVSKWGPIGDVLTQSLRPSDLLNQSLAVTGWFRRGVTPWIDVEMLRTPGGRTYWSGHPVWSTILAGLAAVGGIYVIYNNGFL